MLNALNWLLLKIGDAAQWLWAAVSSFFGWVWDGFVGLLNPVLSPLLALLNPICTAAADIVYAPLELFPAWVGITLISAVAGVLMMIVFRYTSNQTAIGRARDNITANLLTLKLFKDDLRVAFGAQRRLVGAILRLQWHMLRPVLIMLPPMLLLLAQMGLRYQWRPLRVGEQTILRVKLAGEATDYLGATVTANPGVAVELGPVPGNNELAWRLRATQPGRHLLKIQLDDAVIEKEMVISPDRTRVSPVRPGHHWTTQVLYPAEPPIPADVPVRRIELDLPSEESWIYGENYWILYFFIVSMLAALLVKPFFKVRI